MKSVVSALIEAFKTMFHPKMLSQLLWPMLAATVLWVGAAWIFWGSWITTLTNLVQSTPLEQWMQHGFLSVVSRYLISIILVLLLLPAIYVTALVVTAVFTMPMMVSHVALKNYPELERKKGGTTLGSVGNAAVAIAVYCIGWVLCLPLWLFFPLALVLPITLMAYLSQRLFRYDALAEHASKEEFERVIERAGTKLYLLGAVLGMLQLVPVLNLFTPVYAALAFIHLCLAELKQLRQPVQAA